MLTTTLDPAESIHGRPPQEMQRLGLLLLWSADEPARCGEVALVPPISRNAELLLGRGGEALDLGRHLGWTRQRPGENESTGYLTSPRVSRVQLRIRQPAADCLSLTNVGRRPLLCRGVASETVTVRAGDILELSNIAAFMVVSRPARLPALDPHLWPDPLHAFGQPDRFGLVGESPAAWALRSQLGFIAGRASHVLVRGPSGSGKELVAQAIHALSPRRGRPLIARNATTFPESLVDAELFGNIKNFPNVGTPERPGLIGEADGSTLFLDEFGELSPAVQAHLLRVLDGGEYSRLGEARPRRADLRLIAATNRPPTAIKEDVLARLQLRLELPGLPERREDVLPIAVHLLRQLARTDAAVARRCFPDADPEAWPRLGLRLVDALVRWPYTTHVRELAALLWRALGEPDDSGTLDLPADVVPPRFGEPPAEPATADEPAPASPPVDPLEIPPSRIQEVLDAHGGRQEPAWRALGLSSRHVLTRLVRRYGLRVRGRAGEDDDT